MALNPQERAQYAQALLRCFDTDYFYCGRNLRFINDVVGVSLLADVQSQVTNWAPFIAAGMDANSRQWWSDQMTRIYNVTTTT